jgi:hypothetical protein
MSLDENIGPWSISVTPPKDKPSPIATFTKRGVGCTNEFFVMKNVKKNKQIDGIESIARKYPTPSCLPTGKRISGI